MLTIKKRSVVDRLVEGLRVLGWNPSISTLSSDGTIKGYTFGIVVDIGDERLKWEPHARNPVIDFFSIANVAKSLKSNGATLKPIGFESVMCGLDAVEIVSNKGEKPIEFIARIKAMSPPQMSLNFDMGIQPDSAKRSSRRVSP